MRATWHEPVAGLRGGLTAQCHRGIIHAEGGVAHCVETEKPQRQGKGVECAK